jgi:protein-tyrosine phosphatase
MAAGSFAARQLRSSIVEEADLVLGANPRHRSAVIERAPAALRTAFGLREFARLAAAVDAGGLPVDPVERAHSMVERARMQRGLTPPVSPDEDRIPDPMGQPQRVHHLAATLIQEAVGTIVDVIAPPARSL